MCCFGKRGMARPADFAYLSVSIHRRTMRVMTASAPQFTATRSRALAFG
jgi:hypothetical protein